jgi:hypothetical protein
VSAGERGFAIVVDEVRHVIEVTYPAHPSAEDVERYRSEIKDAIARMRGPWDCMVDQRPLAVLPPGLVEEVAALNAYAEKHGMRRAARVVSSAVATLQSARMMRQAALSTEVRTFATREAAADWLASKPR